MPSRFQLPPIVKAAERLLVDIEQAVSRFPRAHRYAIGSDLRKKAMHVYSQACRAWRETTHKRHHVERLVWMVDELQQHMQIAKLLHAFVNFRQFEHLARQVNAIGAQAGGWRRNFQQSPSVQNAAGLKTGPQRDQKLSTRAASAGANP